MGGSGRLSSLQELELALVRSALGESHLWKLMALLAAGANPNALVDCGKKDGESRTMSPLSVAVRSGPRTSAYILLAAGANPTSDLIREGVRDFFEEFLSDDAFKAILGIIQNGALLRALARPALEGGDDWLLCMCRILHVVHVDKHPLPPDIATEVYHQFDSRPERSRFFPVALLLAACADPNAEIAVDGDPASDAPVKISLRAEALHRGDKEMCSFLEEVDTYKPVFAEAVGRQVVPSQSEMAAEELLDMGALDIQKVARYFTEQKISVLEVFDAVIDRVAANPKPHKALLSSLLCVAVVLDENEAAEALLTRVGEAELCREEDDSSRTALWYAASNGNTPLVEMLIARNFFFNRLDDENVSPLCAACNHGHARAAQALLLARANVDGAYKGKTSITPLMYACHLGHPEFVALLLKHEADVLLKLQGEEDGPRSAMDFAEASKSADAQQCVELLKAHAVQTAYAEGELQLGGGKGGKGGKPKTSVREKGSKKKGAREQVAAKPSCGGGVRAAAAAWPRARRCRARASTRPRRRRRRCG